MRLFPRAAFVAALFFSAPAMASDLALPPEAYGRYAPAGDCAKQPRIEVDRAGVRLDTSAGKRGPLPIMVSYTWGGGARYGGIQTWALVKHGGKDQWGEDKMPVLLTFNAQEQRGALAVERIEPQAALDGPLASIVRTGSFRICR